MERLNNKPKSYKLLDGCWNCQHVDRSKTAFTIYPICSAYQHKFWVQSYGKCKRWQELPENKRETL